MTTAIDVDSAIREALDRFARAYESKDVEAVLRLFAPGHDVRGVGTGADEIRLNRDAVREQIERDFSQSDKLSVSYQDKHVSSSGDVAWALAPCTITVSAAGQNIRLDLRLTAVFERRGDEWLIRQMHLSAPMGGQEAGESYPTS